MTKFNITYRGPSGRVVDSVSGLTWDRNQTHEVDEVTKNRLCPESVESEDKTKKGLRGALLSRPSPHSAKWDVAEISEPTKGFGERTLVRDVPKSNGAGGEASTEPTGTKKTSKQPAKGEED